MTEESAAPRKMEIALPLVWSLFILMVMVLLSKIAWVQTPDDRMLATHWGVDGLPDGFSSKGVALFLFPVMALVITLLFAVIARVLEPRRQNLALSARAFTAIWLVAVGSLLPIHAFIALWAIGIQLNVALVVAVSVGIPFIIIGNVLGKLRSNFFAGIRTPWTLSSNHVWDQTQRLGGRLLMLTGALMLLSAWQSDLLLLTVLLIGEVLLMTGITILYSFLLWLKDPARTGKGPETAPTYRYATPIAMAPMLLFAALVFLFGVVLKPSPTAYQAQAKGVVLAMAAGDFVQATEHFDPLMRSGLPPRKLQQVWEQLTTQAGPFQHIVRMRNTHTFPFTSVYVTCQFERQALAIQVVFSPGGRVSGLWIVPPR